MPTAEKAYALVCEDCDMEMAEDGNLEYECLCCNRRIILPSDIDHLVLSAQLFQASTFFIAQGIRLNVKL